MEETEEISQRPRPCLYMLNPARGATVWLAPHYQESITWFSFASLKNKTHLETMEGELEITLSPFTSRCDFGPLLSGLFLYNHHHMDSYGSEETFRVVGSTIQGHLFGETVFVTGSKIGDIIFSIHSIEDECFTKGARRIYIPLKEKDGEAIHQLTEEGYTSLPIDSKKSTLDYDYLLMKELANPPLSCASQSLEWQPAFTRDSFSEISDNFGIFIRNQWGAVVGGIWGTLHPEASASHLHIDVFFIEESFRGTGYGKILMKETETYAKSLGLRYIFLSTADCQAPAFYEKIGFGRNNTLPHLYRNKGGSLGNFYTYYKKMD